MHPKFAVDDLLTAAATEYLEKHPDLDPSRVSIEFHGNPVAGYRAVGHLLLDDRQHGYPCPQLPMPASTRDAAEKILIAHQRRDYRSCICGWSELGKSHPGHQVAMLAEAALLADLSRAYLPEGQTS